jgi:hypothetical protein
LHSPLVSLPVATITFSVLVLVDPVGYADAGADLRHYRFPLV